MKMLSSIALGLLVLALTASPAHAQLLAAKDGPIVYGHHHVNATSIDAHKKFWADSLGGTAIKVGTNNQDIIRFPNVLIFMRMQAAQGGSKGTTADHIGFSVPSLRPVLDRVMANGFTVTTREEMAPTQEVKDGIATLGRPGGPGLSIAFVVGPDDVKVELVEQPMQAEPVKLHHHHFYGQENMAMRDWYVKVFGAKPRPVTGAGAPAADLPGLALNFSPSMTPVVGTQGRGVDHIGFEVKNLEAFTKQLEAQGIKLSVAYRQVPALGIAIAFITDPWGTYIELTEGLGKIQ